MAPRFGGRIVFVFGACAVGGVLIFVGLVWRAVAITEAASAASEEFAAARAALSGRALVDIDDQGRVTPAGVCTRSRARADRPPEGDGLLAAHGADRQSGCAIWFPKLKGPAARLALRDTGVDLEALGSP
jgi:hypothetical protein